MTTLLAQGCPSLDVLAFVPLALSVLAGLVAAAGLALVRRPVGTAASIGLMTLAFTTPLVVLAQLTVAC